MLDQYSLFYCRWFSRCSLIVPEESEEETAARVKAEAARTDIPQGALELARSFRVLHNLMITSREIFKKADANLALFAEQQDIIRHVSAPLVPLLFLIIFFSLLLLLVFDCALCVHYNN